MSIQILSQAAKKPRSGAPRVTPEEEQGLAANLGNKALGGLSAIGNFLSTPQSMVMDLLNFQNPLDQLATPFSPENRTSAKDLLQKYNIISKKNSWANFLPSFALDVATDPLTYLTLGGGALSKGGEAARRIGVMKEAGTIAAGKLGKVANTADAILTGTVGPRRAGMVATLQDVADSVRNQGGAKSVAFDTDLQHYAQTQGYSGSGDFLLKHGQEPLRGLVGVGLPFTGEQKILGTGPIAQKFAAGQDALARAAGSSYPVRMIKQLFHAPSQGLASKEEQIVAPMAYREQQAAKPIVRAEIHDAIDRLDAVQGDFTSTFGHLSQMTSTDPVIAAMLPKRNLHEFGRWISETGIGDPNAVMSFQDAAEDFFDLQQGSLQGKIPAGFEQKMIDATASTRNVQTKLREDLLAHGHDIGLVADESGVFNYDTRSITANKFVDSLAGGRRMNKQEADMMRSRNDVLRGVPARIIENMLKEHVPGGLLTDTHPNFTGLVDDEIDNFTNVNNGVAPSPAMVKQMEQGIRVHQRENAVKKFTDRYPQIFDTKRANAPELPGGVPLASPEDWANRVFDVYYELPRSTKQKILDGKPLYDDHLTSIEKYLVGGNKVLASSKTILDTYANLGRNISSITDPTPSVDLLTALEKSGFTAPDKAIEMMAKKMGMDVPDLANVHVPQGFVDAANALIQMHTNPVQSHSLLRATIDGLTKVIKENLTLPFASFAVRNLGSGLGGMNILSGEVRSFVDLGGYLKAVKESYDLMLGKKIDPQMLREMFIHDIQQYGVVTGDIPVGGTTHAFDKLPQPWTDYKTTIAEAKAVPPLGLFNETPEILKEAHNAVLQTMPPAAIQYSRDLKNKGMSIFESAANRGRVAQQTVLKTGAKANQQVEFLNRGSMYIYLRKVKGFSPEEAARRVREIHVDYSDLAPFEKDYARKVFPFYSFARKQLTETIRNLYQSPGGALAQTIKGVNRLRDPNGLTPDYVAETASIPLGETDAGDKNYLTGFGLAFEDPLSFFGKGVRGAGLELMSRLNPLLKGPMEYATGQTFFQATPEGGRSLGDTDPVLGRIAANLTGSEQAYRFNPLLESLASNSPASRYLTTLRTLTDTRKSSLAKAVNLGTGVRIATISPQASDAVLRERAMSALRQAGGKSFVRSYIPDYAQQTMDPKELADAKNIEALLNTLADRAKKRKQAKQNAAALAATRA